MDHSIPILYECLAYRLTSGPEWIVGALKIVYYVLCIVLYCGRVPAANVPGCTAAEGLLYKPWSLVVPSSYLHRQVSLPETLVVKGGTTWARSDRWILPENARLPRNIQGSFTCRKFTTRDKRLYFPEDFFALKNPTASAGFEPANLGTRGQHATCRPPKPHVLCILL